MSCLPMYNYFLTPNRGLKLPIPVINISRWPLTRILEICFPRSAFYKTSCFMPMKMDRVFQNVCI